MDKRWRHYLQPFSLPLAVLAVWLVSTRFRLVDPYLLPPLPGVLAEVRLLWEDGSLWEHVMTSLLRVLAGFSIASVSGVAVGFALGLSRRLNHYLDPTLRFLRQIPPVAFIPLFILWFGIDEGSKQAVIIYATFFPILVNTELGVSNADQGLMELSRAYCLPPRTSLARVVIPGALPSVFAGLRLGLGNSWRALVAAEMIAASSGIGYMIMEARSLARPEGVILGILLIGTIGTLMDAAIIRMERAFMPWRGGVGQ